MKIMCYATFATLCLTLGCNNNDELAKLNADLETQNATLVRDLMSRDEYIDTVTQSINDINTSL